MGPGNQGADGDARVVLMEVESGHHRDAQLQPDHGQDGQFILGGPTDVGVNARLLDHPGDVVVIGPVFQDEGFAGQLGQGELLTARQRVPVGDHRPDFILQEGNPVILAVLMVAAKGQVHRALPQPFIQLLLPALPDGDGDAGVMLGEVPEDFRQPETGDGGKGGQGDGAHGQAADIGGLLLQLAALSVQVPQQRENPLAVLGGTDAGTGADQKGKTQLCLQGLDDITESGLGVPQLFRRPCQVAQVNGGEQGHAFVLVHGASFPGRDRGEPFGSIGKSNDKGGFSLFYKGKWV